MYPETRQVMSPVQTGSPFQLQVLGVHTGNQTTRLRVAANREGKGTELSGNRDRHRALLPIKPSPSSFLESSQCSLQSESVHQVLSLSLGDVSLSLGDLEQPCSRKTEAERKEHLKRKPNLHGACACAERETATSMFIVKSSPFPN